MGPPIELLSFIKPPISTASLSLNPTLPRRHLIKKKKGMVAHGLPVIIIIIIIRKCGNRAHGIHLNLIYDK